MKVNSEWTMKSNEQQTRFAFREKHRNNNYRIFQMK